ncbi:hypothetical protein BZZ08_00335 [Streptomyces sp. MH60]|nr:hypothetical protein BZZ08_00335 [Streptomyces sp. MH60]
MQQPSWTTLSPAVCSWRLRGLPRQTDHLHAVRTENQRFTVTLIATAVQAVAIPRRLTGPPKTDAINQAVQVDAFPAQQMAEDRKLPRSHLALTRRSLSLAPLSKSPMPSIGSSCPHH